MIIRSPDHWPAVYASLDKARKGMFEPFPKSGVEVIWRVADVGSYRTEAQNNYYWMVVVCRVSDHLTEKYNFPFTKQTAHELLKSEFLPASFHRTCPVTGRVFYGSTTKLKKGDEAEDSWGVYIRKIQRWAALSGLNIPDPNEPTSD